MLWFVAQAGVLHNTIAERVDAYPLSSEYIDNAFNMVNHMLAVSRCFLPRTTKAAHISTPHLKTVWVSFLGKYRMNQLHFKLIFIRFIFPSQRCHHNCCLCCSSCELKTKRCEKNVPGRKIMLPFFSELSYLRSRANLGISFDFASETTVCGVFSRRYLLFKQTFSALVIVIPKIK